MSRRRFAVLLPILLSSLVAAGRAGAQPEPLLLQNERFAVTATWRAPNGDSGFGVPQPLTSDTGSFWFFDDDNLEVVVKVLAACPVDGHYWVFAAGLTDVEVVLTVEDRLSGETWQRVNPLGQPFQPVQDTAAFATCDVVASACGRGLPSEIAATPRDDVELEALALRLGSGIAADQAIYDRLEADVAALEDQTGLDVEFANEVAPQTLLVGLAPATGGAATILDGPGWSCLADWYGIEEVRFLIAGSQIEWYVVTLDGVYDLEVLAADYLAQTSALQVTRDPRGLISPRPPAVVYCANRTGSTFHHFVVDEATAFDRVLRFTSTPGDAPVAAGSHTAGEPAPEWLPLFEECLGWSVYFESNAFF